MEQYVQKHGTSGPKNALECVSRLLEVLEYAHPRNAQHRDIKPDNIILRDGAADAPILIDWGMSFLPVPGLELKTDIQQEIGNRFLRLPEFSSGAALKRDTVSDVTLCVGILFFLLTGTYPRNLLDEESRKPHHRTETREILGRLMDVDVIQLLDVFDRGFETAVDTRWQSAAELKTALNRVRIGPAVQSRMASDFVRDVNSLMESHAEKLNRAKHDQLKVGEKVLRQAHTELHSVLPYMEFPISGPTINVSEGTVAAQMNVRPIADPAREYGLTVGGRLAGSDIIFEVLGPQPSTLYRCSVTDVPQHQPQIIERIQRELISGFQGKLTS